METIRDNWYDYPHLYDIAFGWDAGTEVDFLEQAFRRFAGRRVERVFEPFCGTGRIAAALAQRGYRVSGLDINAKMLDVARQRAAELGVEVELALGDLAVWTPVEPFDAIVTLIDSFRYLLTAETAAAAVHAFHRNLAPGGVLVIGLDVGENPVEVDAHSHWTAEHDGTRVETIVSDLRKPGATPGTSIVRTVQHIREPDGREWELLTDDEMRKYTLASFLELLREHGPFEPVGTYDLHYDFAKPVEDAQHNGDVVVVLLSAHDGVEVLAFRHNGAV